MVGAGPFYLSRIIILPQDNMTQFLVQIKYHDLTQIPVDVTVVETRIIRTSKQEIIKLRKAFETAFGKDGDGGDNHHSINVIEIGEVSSWTIAEADEWLVKFSQDLIELEES